MFFDEIGFSLKHKLNAYFSLFFFACFHAGSVFTKDMVFLTFNLLKYEK